MEEYADPVWDEDEFKEAYEHGNYQFGGRRFRPPRGRGASGSFGGRNFRTMEQMMQVTIKTKKEMGRKRAAKNTQPTYNPISKPPWKPNWSGTSKIKKEEPKFKKEEWKGKGVAT
ncbi:hypothetical protein GH714_004238 [Hevea brasiliensis]|uniref:Uncharacterized protein n=1 Tax=Hevea brasiliensis TaxID=3981 RepID=A0A6A6KNC9_HEVBR|nr:hypothetical protein GH714_004238 [Hevea brasiliensis]